MQEEIECKFLNIDKEALVHKLEQLGAEFVFKKMFKRYVFDYPDLRMDKEAAWLRLRDEGDKITFAYKKRFGLSEGKNDKGMQEIETEVNDLEKTAEILKAIGLTPKFYEENERILYILDDVEVAIDTWPLLNPYVELEGKSWTDLEKVAKKLGFNYSEKKVYSTNQIYEENGINELDYSVLTFEKQIKK